MHQLVDPLTVDFREFTTTVAVGLDHDVTGAVGEVGDGLMVGAVGEGKHFSLGGSGKRFASHVLKIN